MKQLPLAILLCVAAGGLTATAQTVVYSDNFNVPDTTTFDTATLAGRTSGLASANVQPESGGSEQAISGGQLSLTLNGGASTSEVRFDTVGATTTLYDWSSGAAGAAITAAGGMTVSFDWTAANTTSGNWIFFAAGTAGDISYNNLRVVNASTDNGILIKNTGAAQAFNSGANLSNGSFTPTGVNHQVTLTYSFNSWAVGAPVTLNANVDGTAVLTDSFSWTHGTGAQYLDIGTYGNNNNLIDNLTISTVPEPGTWTMMAGGVGVLLVFRRFRRVQV